jgi:hypothetical protein
LDTIRGRLLDLIRLAVASPSWDTSDSFDVCLVRAENVLGLVAPAVLVPVFIGMIGDLQLAGNVDTFAAQMQAGSFVRGALLVVVLRECHR